MAPQPEKTISKLVGQRDRIRDNLNGFREYVKTIEKTDLKATVTDQIENMRIETELRLERVSGSLNVVENLQEKINELIVDDDVIDEQKIQFDSFQTCYFQTLAKAKQIIAKFKRFEETVNINPVPDLNSTVKLDTDMVKLPSIPLPHFSGNYNSWIEFRDKFKSLIHENSKITNIQKYHYLRQSLTDKAAQTVKSIEFGENYYETAWNSLCDKYNNSEKLIHNHIKSILEYEPIVKATSIKLTDFADELKNNLESLKQLGEPVESWSSLIIYITSKKLDLQTKNEWKKHKNTLQKPILIQNLIDFLKGRSDLLEDVEDDQASFKAYKKHDHQNTSRGFHTSNSQQHNFIRTCPYCQKDHLIVFCPGFLNLSVIERVNKVKELKLCSNCLRRNHETNKCRLGGCKKCNKPHNTVLHIEKTPVSAVTTTYENFNDNTADRDDQIRDNVLSAAAACSFATDTVEITHSGAAGAILSTAEVLVQNSVKARALLDCGSQSSFISKRLSDKLKLQKIKTNLAVSGINNSLSYAKFKCIVKLRSLYSEYECEISCFVIEKITGSLPEQNFDKTKLNIPLNIQLADIKFNLSNDIDLLIGIDAFWDLILFEQISLGKGLPILQRTKLGWIVAGPLNIFADNNYSICNFSKNASVNDLLKKFWEVEEVDNKKAWSQEEIECENHFKKNVKRNETGKFIVSIPFKDSLCKLGQSRQQAEKQFLQLEKRLQSNEKLRNMYTDFLNEYENLNHMTLDNDSDSLEYYMPHHGVLREDHITTKLRVVFNASAPTSSGFSLNDLQLNGPIIQDELTNILLRFRLHFVVMSADIKMMYRCVLIEPSQRCLQKIIWRKDNQHKLSTFKLNTVTYGQTASSFLAIRCLHELADEVNETHPHISQIIKKDMYVDDLLTGADSIESAKIIREQISDILITADFDLRKWNSNAPEVLKNHESNKTLEFQSTKDQNSNKTLGLSWSSESDNLMYIIRPFCSDKITKRVILSRIATIFDPLGLLSPCIIIAKSLLQKLWLAKIGWDDPIPADIQKTWCDFEINMDSLNNLLIKRKITCDGPVYFELHGYSDASQIGMGASVYVKTVNVKNEVEINLLIAKSKVAPLRTLTIPRLELIAALMLARLVKRVENALYSVKINRIFCWSDSTIVLGWLKTPPKLLKSFVDNRVAEIQHLSKTYQWRHISTHDNPADLISRRKSQINFEFGFVVAWASLVSI